MQKCLWHLRSIFLDLPSIPLRCKTHIRIYLQRVHWAYIAILQVIKTLAWNIIYPWVQATRREQGPQLVCLCHEGGQKKRKCYTDCCWLCNLQPIAKCIVSIQCFSLSLFFFVGVTNNACVHIQRKSCVHAARAKMEKKRDEKERGKGTTTFQSTEYKRTVAVLHGF